ncbi:MAG: hypothetical protein KatS3mg125_0910 [Lysobacterales bacterium]|jgi:hypothetical protein|nr:MAG: hypothetical protein KatS3mg125_0910 [Xanthomonadales bacterium]
MPLLHIAVGLAAALQTVENSVYATVPFSLSPVRTTCAARWSFADEESMRTGLGNLNPLT